MKRTLSIILSAVAGMAFADGIAIGSNAVATATSAIAIGDNSRATVSGAVAIGNGTTNTTGGVAIGGYQLMDASGNIPAARLANVPQQTESDPVFAAWTTNASEIVVGRGAEKASQATASIAIGRESTVQAAHDIAIGRGAKVNASRADRSIGSSAIGYNAVVTNAKNAMQLGAGTNTTSQSLRFRDTTIVADGKIVSANLDMVPEPSGTATAAVSAHNADGAAHGDIRTALAGKQAAISDLATIRAGAALGATALQSYTETDPNVPAWAKADSKPTYAWSEITGRPTIPTALSQLTADTTHRLVTDSEKSTWNGKQNALTAGANITISGNTISATIPAPSITVSWNTAAKGANPTESLAVAACTYYRRTGSGTYTFSAISGLTAVPTYFVLEGFGSLVLPAGVQNVGSGIFRSGKKNHFAMWTTPAGTFVNYLFALP